MRPQEDMSTPGSSPGAGRGDDVVQDMPSPPTTPMLINSPPTPGQHAGANGADDRHQSEVRQ